jgi:lysozyme
MTLLVTAQGIAMIKAFEGFRADAYLDIGGVPTIGYGETQGVKMGDTVTEAKAAADLKLRVDHDFAPRVLDALPKFRGSMSLNEFDALVSFAYNIGSAAFAGSTMAKLLEAGDVMNAAEQFAIWNHTGGYEVRALTKRRAHEMRVFLSGH